MKKPGQREKRQGRQVLKRPRVKLPESQFEFKARLAALEARLNLLEEAADQNTRVFSDSIKMAEISLFVMQRIQNDVLNGILRFTGGSCLIDFQGYLIEFLLCTEILPLFIKTFAPAEVVQELEEPGTFVFGG